MRSRECWNHRPPLRCITNAEPWIVTLQPAPVPRLSSALTTIVPVTFCAALL
jgi:hypothetical protein